MTESDFYLIKDNQVFLKPTTWFNERSIGELKEANQHYTIDAMIERFSEAEEKIKEIQKEFETTDDIVKLAGKISRVKNYLCNAKAIGNYAPLFQQLEKIEAAIKIAVDDNLVKKEQLCTQAETLLEDKNWKEGTEKLRELQKQFRDLPNVPDLKNETLKERFEKAKDDFFKQKQASFESFEQDLLDNLSKKIDLCEKAEQIQHSTDWKKTTEEYQALNEEWKKIGIVPKHRMEEIWFRFNAAKDVFFNKKKEHFGDIKVEQEENLVKKLALIEQAETLKESKDWKKTSEQYNLLMEEWKKIGRVPQEKSDEVWNQFLAVKNHFYQNKDAHYSNLRVGLEDNYAKKMAIVTHAEELQNTMDFENATQEFMDMFEEWKKIGRIPKEYGDEPWERFLAAKRKFFDRKDADRDQRRNEMNKDILERVARNRGYYNKINRELQTEEDLLIDVQDRMNNLATSLRSYEKKEEYQEMIEGIKKKIAELNDKCKEVKDKIIQDEKSIGGYSRGFKKHHRDDTKTHQDKPIEHNIEHKVNNTENATNKEVVAEEIEISQEDALKNLLNKYKK